MIPLVARQIKRQNKINKKLIGMTTKNRLLEHFHPGHTRIFWSELSERQANKSAVSFFCKFVLASRGKKLPLR